MKTSTADSYFSKCIRASNDYVCARCGTQYDKSSSGLHCSHNFSRRHRTIRWCVDNALPMCYGCHQWFGGNPADSGRWLTELVGDGTIDLLREKMNSRAKVPKSEEALIAKHYREQLKMIESNPNHVLESYQ